MKKLFLLIAAFTCMPTYTDNNLDPVHCALIAVGTCGTLVLGTYAYNHYFKTPTNNTSQQVDTDNADDANNNIIPEKNVSYNNIPAPIIPAPNKDKYPLHFDTSPTQNNGKKINKSSLKELVKLSKNISPIEEIIQAIEEYGMNENYY